MAAKFIVQNAGPDDLRIAKRVGGEPALFLCRLPERAVMDFELVEGTTLVIRAQSPNPNTLVSPPELPPPAAGADVA